MAYYRPLIMVMSPCLCYLTLVQLLTLLIIICRSYLSAYYQFLDEKETFLHILMALFHCMVSSQQIIDWSERIINITTSTLRNTVS